MVTQARHGSGGVQIQDQGRRVLATLYAAMRSLKLYPIENATVQDALDELHSVMSGLARAEGVVEIRLVGDFFFLNGTRLRLDLKNFSTFGAIAAAFRAQGVGAVVVLKEITKEEWAPLLSILLREPDPEQPYDAFVARLTAAPVYNIETQAEQDVYDPDLEEEEALQAAKRTYAQSVNLAKDVLTDMRLGRAVNVRKVKRAVQGIVDQVLSNEPSIVAMTTLKDFDEYTFTHCVNVCIFSVVMGQRLGLDKHQLFELGLGALFHDVGKMRIDREIINKAGGLTDEEWERLKEHPTEGLLVLFGMHGFADIPYRQMLMAYEHHMKADLSGYPENRRPRTPRLFSRIVAVADGFDAGTSVRSYQYKPWSPDDVLKEMRDNERRGFDPLLVKALINCTGVYPVGTLVILDTLELGVVAQPNRDPDHMNQPVVKIISDSMGSPLAEPVTADLTEMDPATGKPKRSIIKTTSPEKYGIQVADYVT